MKNKISVSASFKCGFGMELETLSLTNDSGTITIDKEQWQEIQDTLQGKRKKAASQEMNGYYPVESFVWN